MVQAKQRGMTAIGVLLILVLVGVVALAVIKLVPVYMEHFAVTSSLESLQEDPGDGPLTPRTLEKLLMRRLSINDADGVKREHVEVEKIDGGHQVTVKYERRVPFVSNIDFVVSFEDQAEVGSR